MTFKQKKYWIGVAAVWTVWIGVSILSFLFVLQPQSQKHKTIHDQFCASNDRVSIARMASQEDTQARQADLLAKLQSRIDHFLVPGEQQDRLVFEVSRLANLYQLSDYAGKTRYDIWGYEKGEDVNVQRVWMSLAFKASFQQFASFINAMERHLPTVFVERVSIERDRQRNSQHRAKLLISFFTEPQKNDSNTAVTAVIEKTREGSS